MESHPCTRADGRCRVAVRAQPSTAARELTIINELSIFCARGGELIKQKAVGLFAYCKSVASLREPGGSQLARGG